MKRRTESRFHPIRTPLDAAAAFDDIGAWRAQAVTAGGLQINLARKRVAELALRHRLPLASLSRELVEAGGLLSYGVFESEQAALDLRWDEMIDRILRGALPADIPVERPSRYELVIDLKTAKALGLTVPPLLLARADDVIQ